MKYQEFLKSNTWKKQKNRAKYWHGRKCAICGLKKVDIHHKTYKNGWGNEDPKIHLIPLCRAHHFEAHEFAKKENLHIYQATEKLIAIKKPKKERTWKNMSPYEREKFLDKGL